MSGTRKNKNSDSVTCPEKGENNKMWRVIRPVKVVLIIGKILEEIIYEQLYKKVG